MAGVAVFCLLHAVLSSTEHLRQPREPAFSTHRTSVSILGLLFDLVMEQEKTSLETTEAMEDGLDKWEFEAAVEASPAMVRVDQQPVVLPCGTFMPVPRQAVQLPPRA